MDLPPSLETVSNWPQKGQTGPSGQRDASRNSRALSSSVNAGLVRSHMAVSYDLEYATNHRFSQLYSCRSCCFVLRPFDSNIPSVTAFGCGVHVVVVLRRKPSQGIRRISLHE